MNLNKIINNGTSSAFKTLKSAWVTSKFYHKDVYDFDAQSVGSSEPVDVQGIKKSEYTEDNASFVEYLFQKDKLPDLKRFDKITNAEGDFSIIGPTKTVGNLIIIKMQRI